jgi:UDP-N-acetylmuramoylalanine--D-glutamate ligase
MDVAGAPLRAGDLARSDPTFLVDVAAAAATALVMGADPPGVIAGALGFVPEPHRRQVVGSWDAVTWVDDSKATNPHAALAAIRSYPSVVLIAGGRNKDLDVAVLGAEPNVRFVVGVGEAGPDVVAGARSGTMAADMDDAVAIAARRARPGDTVLLAPGCASFDMYRSYAERGERFAEAVRRQKEGT